MKIFYSILSLLLLLMVGCHRQEHDPRLVRVADLAERSYDEALAALDSINPDDLSDADRHFYDLLTIKANDKNYNRHTSDSLILDVISYYDSHKDDPYYPVALYYGGRVYSDLGDYPTSLKYFQRAADVLRDDDTNLNLKANVLSQTARLLTSLRLFKEAIPYITQSLEVDSILNDSINEVYDLQSLGYISMRMNAPDTAERYFMKALLKSKNLPEKHTAKSKMYLAYVKYMKGEIDSALILIRETPEKVSPLARNSAWSYAVNIYRTAGIMDTACIYADLLIHSLDKTNKQTGYKVLLDPEVRSMANPDSIDSYISSYRTILESLLNENENQLALLQQTQYNYQLHDRDKIKAQKKKNLFLELLIIALGILFILAVCVFYYKNKNKNNIIRLQQALVNLKALNQRLEEIDQNQGTYDNGMVSPQNNEFPIQDEKKLSLGQPDEEHLREELRKELLSFSNLSKKTYVVPEKILQSEVYKKLQRKINCRESISMGDEGRIWDELEKLVSEVSPNFITNLTLLTAGHLSKLERQTSLLIKCGFTPTEIAILIGRDKATVTYRRNMIGKMIFDDKVDPKTTDNIIRLL